MKLNLLNLLNLLNNMELTDQQKEVLETVLKDAIAYNEYDKTTNVVIKNIIKKIK